MKRVLCFLITLVVMICVSISCKEKNPVDDLPDSQLDTTGTPLDTIIPKDSLHVDSIPADSIPADTIPADTVPVDTIPVDTVPVDTIPTDTIPLDTTIIDTALVHELYLANFVGVITVDETGYERKDVRVELAKSDSTEEKIKMILYQVSFDKSMPVCDIMLENVSADAEGNVWCDSIAPVWLNAFGVEGFNMPFVDYMVYSMRGQTYYDPQTKRKYYSTLLNIKNVGEARYMGEVKIEN